MQASKHNLDFLNLRQGDFIIDGSSVAVSAAAPRESDFSPRYGQSASYGLPSQGRHSRRFSDKYGYSPETVTFKNPDYVSDSGILVGSGTATINLPSSFYVIFT